MFSNFASYFSSWSAIFSLNFASFLECLSSKFESRYLIVLEVLVEKSICVT